MPQNENLHPAGIRWNEVTWYSKLGAVILFLVIVPALAFYIGSQYELVRDTYSLTVPIDSLSKADSQNSSARTNVTFPTNSTSTLGLDQLKMPFSDASQSDTSGWLTYVNQNYGFSIKYPKDYLLKETKNPFSVLIVSPGQADPASFNISISANTSLSDEISNLEAHGHVIGPVIISKKQINGLQGVLLKGVGGFDYYEKYYFATNKGTLEFSGVTAFGLGDEILSTLKKI